MTGVKIGSLTLNVSVAGDPGAPALILAHPLGVDLSVWDGLAPSLAKNFRLIRFDARGHGASSVPPGPYSLADLGDDVVALMDRLDIAKAHFLGLSMGGAIGQWLMIHAPRRLQKVVLANTASHFPDGAGWNARIRAAREKGVAALAPAILDRWLTPGFRAAQPEKTAAVEALLRASDGAGYAACCSALRDADLRDTIQTAPPRPVLVIVGDCDGSTPPERGAALAASLPDARLLRLKAAHLSCVEKEAEFLAVITEFLGAAVPSPRLRGEG
jgi:3-oxoadipate enol-lactonase